MDPRLSLGPGASGQGTAHVRTTRVRGPPEEVVHMRASCWVEAAAMPWPRPKPVHHFRA